ncbi:DddA-like double-stranded DNA deaminase toxin [Polymorphospora lycopeni]|uniref:DddA-like double-stranded DNA deaminase toxin n=1 Tax=Polymorphospora lycopeni TaxID=3140240 RepID=A0ABV5CWS2_9ACTN
MPAWIGDAARRLPRRDGDQGPTHGVMFDPDGRRLTRRPIRSGEDPSLADDLVPRARGWMTVISHVESYAAAMMRRNQAPDSVDVVVNNDVCVGPLSCDTLLPGLLRPGQRMRVWVKAPETPEGVRYYDEYEGNGKGIRS